MKKDSRFLKAQNSEGTIYVSCDEIIYIESQGKDITLYTLTGSFSLTHRLKELEEMLPTSDFLRISSCCIIAVRKVKYIKPTFQRKFILTMANDIRVDVTRSYFNQFRERYGI